MSDFIHIITTRFNVPTENWHITRDGKKPLSEEWHEHRFDLFRKYTFPSFKNQTNLNFIWLVFFDTQTTEKYLNIIKNLQEEFQNFIPVFVNHGGEINSGIMDIFRTYFLPETKFVISTDIDNDDLIHKDFVENIQQLYSPINNLVIDLRKGLQMIQKKNNQALILEFYAAANPFVSIVEPVTEFKTIMNEWHNNFRNYPNSVFYDEKGMFIQLIHSHNMMNKAFPNKAFTSINFDDFGIAKKNHPVISALKSGLHNLKRIPTLLKRIISGKR